MDTVRVTGIGGIFFRARDPKALGEWYRRHLGLPVQSWGGAAFSWKSEGNPEGVGTTVWTPFAQDSEHIGAGPLMVNFRVRDLKALVEVLRSEGCDVDPRVEESEFGKFGWLTDPEGNRVELWEPPQGQ